MATQTLNEIFLESLKIERPAAQMYKAGGRWQEVSVAEFGRRVRHLSMALRSMGVKRDDRVAILSENRPEWSQADFAILTANAVSVPVYPTLLAWQIEYILNDSGAVVVIVSNAEQLAKIEEVCKHCPAIRQIILMDPAEELPSNVITLDTALAQGKAVEEEEGTELFEKFLKERKSSDLATIVYTSGTTGNPKGAMLTHGNLTSNVVSSIDPYGLGAGEVALNILPLSHILERTVDFAYFYRGATIAYAEDVTRVADNMQEVRPHYFAAVPRLFEKMQGRILETVAQAPPARQKIFRWALGVAQERLPYVIDQKPMPTGLAWKAAIADRLVFRKIVDRLGGRIKFIISGGAPLSPELAAFFIGAGIEIYEGYGLTETSPVIAANSPKARRIGTVGKPIPGVEVKIAEDGEILTRGPHVMRGYFNNDEATEKTIDSEGWLYTGDIGLIDEDGFLKITDRKKGHHRQRLWKEHRSSTARESFEDLALHQHPRASGRSPQVHRRADRAELRAARARREEDGPRVRIERGDGGRPEDPGDRSEGNRPLQRPAGEAGADSQVHPAPARLLHRRGRDHSLAQGQAQEHR
jgi:long-chain acyl-CoA synthetase